MATDPLASFANLVHYPAVRGTLRSQVARPGIPLPPLPAPAGYDYPAQGAGLRVLAGNGVFKRGRNRHVEAIVPVVPCTVAGLERWWNPVQCPGLCIPRSAGETRIELAIPCLSPRFLEAAMDDARAAGGIETAYQVIITDSRVALAKPPQKGTVSSLDYTDSGGPEVPLDLHSHGNAPAYFSLQDDEDQKGFRFYAVMGHIYTRPSICLRIGVHGDWLPLPVTALFANAGPFRDTFGVEGDPARWRKP